MALCWLGAQRAREATLSQALLFISSGGIDDALMASLRASLTQLEKIARAGLVDEDMPRCVQGIAERQFDEFWIHFREYIEDEVPPPSPPPPSATSTLATAPLRYLHLHPHCHHRHHHLRSLQVYENKSLERAGNRKSLASSTWSSSRTCWPDGGGGCPAPWGWFRAKLLYSLCPADASFWQVFPLY